MRRLRFFFLLGLAFELVLGLLCFALPEGWLSIEIRNFAIGAHYPLLRVMEGLGLGDSNVAILGLLVGLIVMASFWGFFIFLVASLVQQARSRFNFSRRQKVIVWCGLGLLFSIILALAIIASRPDTPIPFTGSPEVKAVVDGNTAFALDLYQKLKAQPGNLFFSPYSISTGLAMTYAGARGETEKEMAGALHFNPAQTNLPTEFGALETRMNQIQRWNRITLSTANSLWGQQDYRFTDAYLNLVRMNFQSEISQVDFKHSPSAASAQINQWVEKKTNGKIRNLLAPGQLTEGTRLVLSDAIYFKGKWVHPFKTADTKPADFKVSTNKTVTVQMMFQEAEFKMAQNEDYTAELLELPYSGRDLSMIILLPERDPLRDSPGTEQGSLSELEQNLTVTNLDVWLAQLDGADPRKTSVGLPRFTTTQSYDLKNELKSLGMLSAFGYTANFSGMDGTKNLFISALLHKAYVEVNEAGTEAAAVTLGMAKAKSMTGRFIVDHPFIFLIRENGSGSILFLGRIMDPTE